MEFVHLAAEYVFEGFGYFALGVSLLFSAFERRHSVHAQQVGNQIAFTRNHREIWTAILNDPELSRILKPTADLLNQPLTVKEDFHVKFLFLHLHSTFTAGKKGMFVPSQHVPKEIADFLTRPIAWAVWEQFRKWQDDDFVAFVENAFRNHGEPDAKTQSAPRLPH